MDIQHEIDTYLQYERATLSLLDIEEIKKAIYYILFTINHQKTIYCFGNGGSASTASHFTNDFNKILNSKLKDKFQFVCLNDNIATIMAIANDISYDEIFRFQLDGRLDPDDLIIAISGSGNSANVINAVTYANECGCIVIGLTGFDGGKLKEISDVNLHAPISNMQITEDIHLMYNHLLVSILSKFLN